MDDKLALYTMFSLAKLLHFHLGWSAQGDLCRVGEEFIDEIFENKEIKAPYNDTDATLKNISELLINKYKVANSITVEIADKMPVAKAAIMSPYKIRVQDCVFKELHPLFMKYELRKNWKDTPSGRDGMFLMCPMMNLLVHAIEINSDFLAGHCLEATNLDKKTCTCLIDVFSRELDIVNLPEEENPGYYRIR